MFIKRFNFITIFVFILFLTNSCTLIGFGIGSIVDENKSDKHYTINEELFDISPETEINLITVTKDTIFGLFKKTTNEYSDDYIVEYNKKYKDIKNQFFIPEIGDTLSISNPMGKIYKYTFLGFDYNKIFVKSAQSRKALVINLNPNVKIKFEDGQYLNHDYINNAFEFRLIPIMSKLHLENKSVSDSIFYHNIHSIQTDSSNRTRYLTLIGLGIDLILWYNLEDNWLHGGKMFKWE